MPRLTAAISSHQSHLCIVRRVEQFAIFVREQQHMARLQAQGAAAASASDLAGYVEFNRSYK